MPRYNPPEKDIIHTLQRDIEALKKRVRQLESPMHPTMTFFTMAPGINNYPDNPPEGLIFINDSEQFCWVTQDGFIRGVLGTLL